MNSFSQNTFPWDASSVDGTTTTAVIDLFRVNRLINGALGFSYKIPTGLTASIAVTNDDPSSASANWISAIASTVGSDSVLGFWDSFPIRGIKVTRAAGSGVVRFNFAQSSSGKRDADGNLLVALANRLAGENLVESINRLMTAGSYNATRITTATTTICKSGEGILGGFFVEVALTGTATVYNNTAGSGTILTILPAGTTAGYHSFPAGFSLGCTVVTSAADRLVALTV